MEFWIRILGIPVKVSLFFFLIVGILGPRGRDFHPLLLGAWVAIAAVGVLAHELGHALLVRRFGRQPTIALHGLGGVTWWSGDVPPARRLLVSAAGPAVGIVIGLAAMAVRRALGLPEGSPVDTVLAYVVRINLGWALFNLLPMLPMDGGKVMASVLELLFRDRGWTIAYVVSIVFIVALALLSIAAKQIFLVLLCALFAWSNFEGLRSSRRRPPEEAPAP